MSICVEVSNKLVLRGLDEKDVEIIEQDLTFSNPQYAKVKKYSRWNTTSVPKFLEYFKIYEEDCEMCAEVPIGYDIHNLYSKVGQIADYRRFNEVKKFPEFVLTLRDTQKKALENYLDLNVSDFSLPHGSVQLPTGKGKTILGLAISKRLSCRTLIIVHKDDLVTGWKKDIEKAFGGKADVGLIKAKSRKIGEHFTIATIQTLNRLTENELDVLYDSFGLVIQDEMHHCPSTSFQLGNNFNCRFRLGLTATPERTDGLEHIMKLFYGDFCYVYEVKEDDEDILQVKVIKRNLLTYFNPVVTKVGDVFRVKRKLEDPINFVRDNSKLKSNECRISDIPYAKRPDILYSSIEYLSAIQYDTMSVVTKDIISEYEQGHSCIAFFSQKEEVEKYRDFLVLNGVNESDIGLYYGNNKDCDSIIDKAENNRKFITLATYSKATEGTNVKQWEVGFLVSSINNGKNVEQAVGRIRRTKPDGEKLETAKLYDYRYNNVYQLSRHGDTRNLRYKKLKFDVGHNTSKSLFSKGWSKN